MKILLSMPDNLVKDIDEMCGKLNYERSEYIRACIRRAIYQGVEPDVTTPPSEIPENKEPITGTMPVEKGDVIKANVEIIKTADSFDIKPIDPNAPITGWCQLHFERGKNFLLRKINWEDENGTVVVDKKWACPKCIEHYQNMGRGRVYFL